MFRKTIRCILLIGMVNLCRTVCAESAAPSSENIAGLLQEQALPDLIRSITEKTKARRFRLVRISGAVQDHSASQYLVQAYEESKEEGIRCKLLESMGKLRDPSLMPWLTRRLDDPSVGIQCFSIWALGELKSRQVGQLLRRKLRHPDRYIQMTAIDALGKSGPDSTLTIEVQPFLHDPDVQVRYLAAKALAGLAGESAAPDLARTLLEESSVDVQEELAKTLGRTGGAVGVGYLIELLKYASSPATEHLAEIGLAVADPEKLATALKPLLEGKDFRLKIAAARILKEAERVASEP